MIYSAIFEFIWAFKTSLRAANFEPDFLGFLENGHRTLWHSADDRAVHTSTLDLSSNLFISSVDTILPFPLPISWLYHPSSEFRSATH